MCSSRYVSFQYCMPTNEKATKNVAIPHPSLAYPREKCMERNNELLTRKYDGRTWNMYKTRFDQFGSTSNSHVLTHVVNTR